jgi:hypothetical protein
VGHLSTDFKTSAVTIRHFTRPAAPAG